MKWQETIEMWRGVSSDRYPTATRKIMVRDGDGWAKMQGYVDDRGVSHPTPGIPRYWYPRTVVLDDLRDLSRVMGTYRSAETTAWVQGRLPEGADRTRNRERKQADLLDPPTRLVRMDLDGLPLRAETAQEGRVALHGWLQAHLPAEMTGATYVAHYSSSALLRGEVKAHVFFAIDPSHPGLTLRQQKEWLVPYGADPAVYTAQSLLYTADPIFFSSAVAPLEVLPDPLISMRGDGPPDRWWYWDGEQEHVVPPEIHVVVRDPQPITTDLSRYMDRPSPLDPIQGPVICRRVVNAPDGERHATIMRQAGIVIARTRAGQQSMHWVVTDFAAAIRATGVADAETLIRWVVAAIQKP